MPRMEHGDNPIQAENPRKSLSSQRQNLIFAVLSLLVCALMPVSAVIGSQGTFGRVSDFPEYYSAARMICQGQGAEIYKLDKLFAVQHECFPDMKDRGIGFYIPPFSAVLLAPLGFLPANSAYCLYMIAELAALVGGIVMLGKHFGMRGAAVIWLATAVCATSPAFEALKIAQLAPFLFASLAGFLLLAGRRRDIAAGVCLAALLLKPQELMPIVVYVLCACRLRIILALAAIFMLLMAASWLFIGHVGFGNYFDLLKDSAVNTQFMQPELSATLRGQLLRMMSGLGNSAANFISAAVLAAVMGLVAWTGFKFGRGTEASSAGRVIEASAAGRETEASDAGRRSEASDAGLLRLALPLGIVSSLHCHDYDLLLLAPFVLCCFLDLNKVERDVVSKKIAIALVSCLGLLLFCLTIPFYVPIHYEWLMKQKQVLNPLFLLLSASALLSAVAFLRNPRATADGEPAQ